MKHIFLAGTLAAVALVAACGGHGNNVTRNDATPLSFAPIKQAAPSYHSSRSAIDLLSLG